MNREIDIYIDKKNHIDFSAGIKENYSESFFCKEISLPLAWKVL